MKVLVLCGVFAVFLHLCTATAPVPDNQLFIHSESVTLSYGPIKSPPRKKNGVCVTIHEKEKPTYPGKRYILRKQVTVPIIVDVQNDFSDDYLESTLPVPGTRGVVTVINWIREQGESWFGWKLSFAGVIRTEDTHPEDHFSFASSKYWETRNMVPPNPAHYEKPIEKATYEFKLGCKVDNSIIEADKQKRNLHADLLKHSKLQQANSGFAGPTSPTNHTSAPSTAIANTEYNHDITLGIVIDQNVALSLYTIDPIPGTTPAEAYVIPKHKKLKMWLWPKHCVVGTDGHKSNKRLITRTTDIVVPKGYYTFRESLTGQVDCDEEEEEDKLVLGQHEVERINLTRYLDDMENPLISRGPSRAKGIVIQNLIIVGFAFEYCVAATALSLASIKTQYGVPRYNVIIVTDGVGYLTPYDDPFRAGIRKTLIEAGVKFVDHQYLVFV